MYNPNRILPSHKVCTSLSTLLINCIMQQNSVLAQSLWWIINPQNLLCRHCFVLDNKIGIGSKWPTETLRKILVDVLITIAQPLFHWFRFQFHVTYIWSHNRHTGGVPSTYSCHFSGWLRVTLTNFPYKSLWARV